MAEPTEDLLDTAWSKGQHTPMTKEEAAHVWNKVHEMAKSFPGGEKILWLNDQLGRELAKGERCAVCGDYRDRKSVV